jgi:uncharacterized protein YkwD
MNPTTAYRRAFLYLLALSLLNGLAFPLAVSAVTPRLVDPDTLPITKTEAVMLLLRARMQTIPIIADAKKFTDVPKKSPSEPYLAAAERFGIIRADDAGRIYPDAQVTRAAFIKMATLTFGLTTNLSYQYLDIPANSWVGSYAGIAFQYDLFPMNASFPMLYPSATVTRGEAKRVLQTLLDEEARQAAEMRTAGEQASYKLQVYGKISGEKENVVRFGGSLPALLVQPDDVTAGDNPAIVSVKQKVLDLVNQERMKNKLAPLHRDAFLSISAQNYADDMARRGFFAHISPEGGTLRDRMTNAGYYNPVKLSKCNCIQKFVVGENLARGQKTAEEVVRDWLKSPTHRSILLGSSFTDTGIGVDAGVWVQHFGGVRYIDEE